MPKKDFRKCCVIMVIAAITLIAFIFRVQCCFWGKPLQLHPDEGATVDHVIEMLSRHSWEAHVYNRPDHFEIKCDAIIFTIVSWIKYHKPAHEAYDEHRMAFFMLARFYTALFGTALIPLTSVFVGELVKAFEGKYKRIIQVCAAILVAFSAIFVQHSAYATPDIVLTFFVLLFAYGMMQYIENGNKKYLYICVISIGIGVTIKYPAAILCIPLAGMVIYRACLIDKKPIDILRYSFISVGMLLFTIFVLAPNLITDINTVYAHFIEEARPNHLGADGLGFSGNLKFYVETIFSDIGTITIFPFIAGLVSIVTHRSRKWFSLLVGLIYWICMSILSLHWLRWGIPIYPFYMIIVAIGMGSAVWAVDKFLVSNKMASYIGKGAIGLFISLVVLNTVLSGLSIVKYSAMPDMRAVAKDFLDENGITDQNSLYEGYTPFAPSAAFSQVSAFTVAGDGVKVQIEYATKKYFIMSNSFKGRYMEAPDRYQEQCAIYNGIESSYEIIYRESGDGNYGTNKNILKNVVNSWKYLTGNQTAIGDTIIVYDMNPVYVTVQAVSGQYLSAVTEESGAGIQLSDDAYQWVEYDSGNDMYTLLSGQSGLALDVTGAVFSIDTQMELWEATGEIAQQWQIIQDEGYCYLVCNNNMALAYGDKGIGLSEYEKAENQRWIIKR